MNENVFYLTSDGRLSHHGILGMHWGVRRFQPYPRGHTGGKEVGQATKVKQRPLSRVDRAKAKTAKIKQKADAKVAKAKQKADLQIEKAKQKQKKEKAKADVRAQKERVQKRTTSINEKTSQLKAQNKPKKPETKPQTQTNQVNSSSSDKVSKKYSDDAKKKLLATGSAADALRWQKAGMLTNAEAQQIVTRLSLESKLSSYSAESKKTASQKIDKLFNGTKKIGDWAEIGLKTYESIEKIVNKSKGNTPNTNTSKKKKKK